MIKVQLEITFTSQARGKTGVITCFCVHAGYLQKFGADYKWKLCYGPLKLSGQLVWLFV